MAGEPCRNRTCDSLLKRQELYLAELTARGWFILPSTPGVVNAGGAMRTPPGGRETSA